MQTSKRASSSTTNKKRAANSTKKQKVKNRKASSDTGRSWLSKWWPALIFVLLFAGLGFYFVFKSSASTSPPLQLNMILGNGYNTKLCLDDSSSSNHVISYPCNSSDTYQQWVLVGVSGGDFMIKNPNTGVCVNDPGAGVGTNQYNRVYVTTHSCDSSTGVVWNWSNSQLYNVYSHVVFNGQSQHGCINDPGSSLSQAQMIVYPCNGGGKTYWDENQISTSGGGGGGGTTSRCGSGSYGALVGSGSAFAGIDEGIDFTPTSSSGYAICAPASGYITRADYGHSYARTPGTALVIERLDTAPNVSSSSRYIYFAELISINSRLTGATPTQAIRVNKGDIIGHNYTNPGIEVGWGYSATQGFLCGYNGSAATACGYSFNTWVRGQ